MVEVFLVSAVEPHPTGLLWSGRGIENKHEPGDIQQISVTIKDVPVVPLSESLTALPYDVCMRPSEEF